jgi:hypothetical protein
MTVLALLYIGGVISILPAISETEEWGVFLLAALLWPVMHLNALMRMLSAKP